MTQEGLVGKPYLIKGSFDNSNFKKYACDVLLPKLKRRQVVFWDRLGRAGRKAKPDKQHYNPQVKSAFKKKHVRVSILPPLGKFFNPCELAAAFLKEDVRHQWKDSAARCEERPWRFEELKEALLTAARKITPRHCAAWFRERANGRAFKEMHPDLFVTSSAKKRRKK